MSKFLIGVDEAGRGPLAGPVSVGVAAIPHDFDWEPLAAVNDSKQLSERVREEVYGTAQELKRAGKLDFSVSLVSAKVIDKIGISKAVLTGIDRALAKLALDPEEVEVRLDGLLRAPQQYQNQQTIIKGDATEQVIGLASILAKVRRDRYMTRIGNQEVFSCYEFPVHKGYGTKKHRAAIVENGLSELHRRSFCRRLSDIN